MIPAKSLKSRRDSRARGCYSRDMSELVSRTVTCGICPKACRIEPGFSGECRVRVNREGTLHAVTYGRPCSIHVDPIEKKPLFHVAPGAPILSVATAGCNLHCSNCQNWQISQGNPEELEAYDLMPAALPDLARRHGCEWVAYTYTEPLVYYEYTYDCCVQAHEAGLRNVLVTAAYVNRGPLARLCPVVSAANVDIKALSDPFYRDVCDASLDPVLKAIVQMKAAGVFLEITNLVIPTLNDSDELLLALCRWVRTHLGAETPLHFSRFFPQHRMTHLPPTPEATLQHARELARAEGLKHVYLGNVRTRDGETTRCPSCDAIAIERERYVVVANRLDAGRCQACGTLLAGVW